MNKGYMGIDLGTSSVKIIIYHQNGEIQKSRAAYEEISPDGWYNAVLKAIAELDTSECVAIGLSSQVGTYIINGKDVIGWSDRCGAEETLEIKNKYSKELFVKEISMPHPDIISYPIPRLMYIRKKYGENARVCQPKDMIIQRLTGNCVTDKYSWRGLANTKNSTYSKMFIKEVGSPILPPIADYFQHVGIINEAVSKATEIPPKTVVYTGLNDFYASLMGMGILSSGEMFDITGTSEHLGIITDSLCSETAMVSSPYIQNYVHYGVTASSGVSAKFAMNCFYADDFVPDAETVKASPVFLPYLNGERAPIFDADASGMFFGINGGCTKKHLTYSVFEGIVFSLYHIYEHLGMPDIQKLTVSGGAANIPLLNTLKAEIFGTDIYVLQESDTSALGAAMVAAVGSGAYENMVEAFQKMCKTKETVSGYGNLKPLMLKRFEIYKELYHQTKNTNYKLKEVQL